MHYHSVAVACARVILQGGRGVQLPPGAVAVSLGLRPLSQVLSQVDFLADALTAVNYFRRLPLLYISHDGSSFTV